ncbi:MAG: sugar transferase [Blautia sp.]|nr:sugar transferase [Blautia sp.]
MENSYGANAMDLGMAGSGVEPEKEPSVFYVIDGTADSGRQTREILGGKVGYRIVKRLFDIVLSILAMVILAPVFLITAIAIKMNDGGPVIHKRYCVGKNGKAFPMYKFRSMVVNADELIDRFPEEIKAQYLQGIKLADDPRITTVGKVIRKASIDELPQLFNVLKGEMSIVGPRPVIEREVQAYAGKAGVLLSVRPGITGTWQVYGRGDAAYLSRESQNLQLAYVENMGFLYDIKILGMTFKKVITGEGAR